MFQCSKMLIEPYGICTHINRKGVSWEYDTRVRDLRMMKSTGSFFYRTDWDLPGMIKRGSNGLDFSHFDSMVVTADSQELKALAIITANNNFLISDMDIWCGQLKQQVSHFRKVKYWEMLNEVDICRQWLPNVYAKEYVEMLRHGYKAVKSGNQKAQVLFSGLSWIGGNFLDSILMAGVNDSFDIMNVHRYNHKEDEPECLIDYFRLLDKKMTKYDIRKPVWMTECGCTTAEGWATEETQANRLPRVFLISFACGIDKVFWYKSRARELNAADEEDFFGLWHKDYSPKPAFYAYQTLTKMCPNKSERPVLRRQGDIYIARWRRPDGKQTYALWTSREKVNVDLKLKGNYACYDIYGEKFSLTRQDIEASPSILYFVGEKKFELGIVDKRKH